MKYLATLGILIFFVSCSSTNNTVNPVTLQTPVTFNGTWGDYIGNNPVPVTAHGAGNATIILTRADDTIAGHFIRYISSTTTILDSGTIGGFSVNKPTNTNYTMTRTPFGTVSFDDPKVNITYKFSSGFADSSSVSIDANR